MVWCVLGGSLQKSRFGFNSRLDLEMKEGTDFTPFPLLLFRVWFLLEGRSLSKSSTVSVGQSMRPTGNDELSLRLLIAILVSGANLGLNDYLYEALGKVLHLLHVRVEALAELRNRVGLYNLNLNVLTELAEEHVGLALREALVQGSVATSVGVGDVVHDGLSVLLVISRFFCSA